MSSDGLPMTPSGHAPASSSPAGVGAHVRSMAARNPFRVLGVYANSSTREQLAHVSRMAAFLRVQRPISFPADAIAQLAEPLRTEETVNNARAAISLPSQRLRHALFWFVNTTPQDAEALECLIQGDASGAEALWAAAGGVAARHNLALCYLFSGRLEKAMPLLEQLYAAHSLELGRLVDESLAPTESELVSLFLSALKDATPDKVGAVAPFVSRPAWKESLSHDESARLMQLIRDCEEKEAQTPDDKLRAAQELAQEALPVLRSLKLLMGDHSPAYSNLADQLATQILLGAIQYYNEKGPLEAAATALRVMKLARSIARGSAVMERCAKNMEAVQDELAEQPTAETGAEGQAIYRLLKELERKKPDVAAVRQFLREAAPQLKALRKRLGAQHAAYLRLSSQVVRYAQSDLNIELSNALQKMTEARERLERQVSSGVNPHQSPWLAALSPAAVDYHAARDKVKALLGEVWAVLRKLEFYDMEPQFRRETFEKRRSSVERLCIQAEVKTDYAVDSMRRHPRTWAFLAFLLMALIGSGFWYVQEMQHQAEELRLLVRKAESKADWEGVVRAVNENTLASNRRKILEKATSELKRIEVEEGLKTRFEEATTAEEFEALVQDAREAERKMPALEVSELIHKAEEQAEEIRARAAQEEHERCWGTEAKAWATVQRERTVEACREYQRLYPGGAHKEQVDKQLIDAEVAGVFASGSYGSLPQTQRTRSYASSSAHISITNDTQYTLTIMYSGPSSKKVHIPPHGSSSVELPAATYKIVASVDASRVRPFAGTETYSGGGYEATYYISSSPLYTPSYRRSSPSSGRSFYSSPSTYGSDSSSNLFP